MYKDENGVSYLCLETLEWITPPKKKKKARKKPERKFSGFEFKIRHADSYDELGMNDNDYFSISKIDEFVAEYAKACKEYKFVDCEVCYHENWGDICYSELNGVLPYKKENKLMKQAYEKILALGLDLSNY